MQLLIFRPRTFNRTDSWRDVVVYFLVKERIQNDAPIYDQPFEPGPHDPKPIYPYPPVLASLLSTLPKMNFSTFTRFWTLLLYGAFWIYAGSLGRLAFGKTSISGTIIASLFLFIFPGTSSALDLGQADPLLWSLMGLALTIPLGRGFFTMAIAIIKPWGIWPLLWSLGRSYWVWLGAGTVLAGSALVGTLALGKFEFFEACQKWFTHVLPSLAQGTWSSGNQSLSFGFLRIVRYSGLWTYNGGELPLWAKNWLLICGIGGPCLTGWYLRQNTENLQMAGVASAAVLFSPICWTSYLPILLTFFAALFYEKSQTQAR